PIFLNKPFHFLNFNQHSPPNVNAWQAPWRMSFLTVQGEIPSISAASGMPRSKRCACITTPLYLRTWSHRCAKPQQIDKTLQKAKNSCQRLSGGVCYLDILIRVGVLVWHWGS